jgi:TldD protein
MNLQDINLNAQTGAFSGYTELRLQENRNRRLVLLNGDLVTNSQTSKLGASARCWSKGQWGFASSGDLKTDTLGTLIASAGRNAGFLASRARGDFNELIESRFGCEKDLSTSQLRVSPAVLIDFIRNLDDYIQRQCPGVKARQLMLAEEDIEKRLITSSGSETYTLLPRVLLYLILTMENDQGEPIDLMQPISRGGAQFEDAFSDPEEIYPQIDWLFQHLKRKREAVPADAGRKTVILDSELTGILAHEAMGHTTEADLVLGGSVAGDYLQQQVASELVSMVDFAHSYRGEQLPIPVWVDDEGCETRDAWLIDKGVLKGFMHNRDTAARYDQPLTGNARGFLFSDEPLIRMRNTAILPGKDKLEDMIASVEDGYYLIKTGNGQADSTSEFMFGVNLGYEIKQGKLGRAITDTTISGVAFDMLKSVSKVSDDLHWECAGYCCKKQPMVVSTGGPALKCEVNIGGE